MDQRINWFELNKANVWRFQWHAPGATGTFAVEHWCVVTAFGQQWRSMAQRNKMDQGLATQAILVGDFGLFMWYLKMLAPALSFKCRWFGF